jgi:HEAT repeat protein
MQSTLSKMLTASSDVVRWRIVHVLGAFPNEANAATLFERLDVDCDRWVRYGAVRSIVELAARAQEDLRHAVFLNMSTRLSALIRDEATLKELISALFVAREEAPPGWGVEASAIVEELYAMESLFEKREHWIQVLYRLKEVYGKHRI